jgi:hypothetical protein
MAVVIECDICGENVEKNQCAKLDLKHWSPLMGVRKTHVHYMIDICGVCAEKLGLLEKSNKETLIHLLQNCVS